MLLLLLLQWGPAITGAQVVLEYFLDVLCMLPVTKCKPYRSGYLPPFSALQQFTVSSACPDRLMPLSPLGQPFLVVLCSDVATSSLAVDGRYTVSLCFSDVCLIDDSFFVFHLLLCFSLTLSNVDVTMVLFMASRSFVHSSVSFFPAGPPPERVLPHGLR